MTKLLHIADLDDINQPGGIEAVIRNIVSHYKEDNCTHTILLRKEIAGFKLFGKAFPSRNKILNRVNDLQPDKVLLYGSTPLIWMSILFLKNLKTKIYLTPFYHDPSFTKSPILSRINWIFLNAAIMRGVKIHFCTHYERKSFYAIKRNSYEVQMPYFSSLVNNAQKLSRNILFVGRDDFHKGLDTFYKLARENSDLNFIAISKERKPRIPLKNLTFLSGLSDEELLRNYNDAKILIFPSAYESFGGVLLEALSCECMVIASSMVKGTEYFLNNPNVFIYEHSKSVINNFNSIQNILRDILKENKKFTKYLSDQETFNHVQLSKQNKKLKQFLSM